MIPFPFIVYSSTLPSVAKIYFWNDFLICQKLSCKFDLFWPIGSSEGFWNIFPNINIFKNSFPTVPRPNPADHDFNTFYFVHLYYVRKLSHEFQLSWPSGSWENFYIYFLYKHVKTVSLLWPDPNPWGHDFNKLDFYCITESFHVNLSFS
jgi:hypothetical protein